MSFDLEDSFENFLCMARKHNMFVIAFDIQDFIFETYKEKGLTREDIYGLPLKDLWPLIKSLKIKEYR